MALVQPRRETVHGIVGRVGEAAGDQSAAKRRVARNTEDAIHQRRAIRGREEQRVLFGPDGISESGYTGNHDRHAETLRFKMRHAMRLPVRWHHETVQRGVETVHPVDMPQPPASVREAKLADAIINPLAIVAVTG